MKVKKVLSTLVLLGVSAVGHCNGNGHADSHEAHRLHDAHVHGVAKLLLVAEGKFITVEFIAPAMDLIGFEHPAKTNKDIKTVMRVVTVLEAGDSPFSFNKARCTLEDSTVDLGDLISADDASVVDEARHAQAEPEDHGADMAHHHHNHSEHDDGDASAEAGAHNDHREISAHYRFSCKRMGKLTVMTTTLFDTFPSLEKIKAQWVLGSGQGAAVLTRSSEGLKIK